MENDMKYARLLDENDIQSIMNCCQICFPNNQEYAKVIPKVKPNAFDIGEFFALKFLALRLALHSQHYLCLG